LARRLRNGKRNRHLLKYYQRQYHGGNLMADKKEVVIKLTSEQRSQIKSATGQDLTEFKVGMTEYAKPLSANPLDDRANPILVLDDRANPEEV
jgi:hypothetical protein